MAASEETSSLSLSAEDAECIIYAILSRASQNDLEIKRLTGLSLYQASCRLFSRAGYKQIHYLKVINGHLPGHTGLGEDVFHRVADFITRNNGDLKSVRDWADLLISFHELPDIRRSLADVYTNAKRDRYLEALQKIKQKPEFIPATGRLETRRAGHIIGWVLPGAENTPRSLKFMVNGELRAMQVASIMRRDLCDIPEDQIHCGFEVSLPASPKDRAEVPLILTIEDVKTGQTLFDPVEIIPSGLEPISIINRANQVLNFLVSQKKSNSADIRQRLDQLQNLLPRLKAASNYPLNEYDLFARHTEPAAARPRLSQIEIIHLNSIIPERSHLKEAGKIKKKYLLFLPKEHSLSASALSLIDQATKNISSAKVIFIDHDTYDPVTDTYTDPHLKGAFDYDLQLQTDHLGPAFIIERESFISVGGFNAGDRASAAYHDLVLRVYENWGLDAFCHLPKCIWHTCPQPDDFERKQADLIASTNAHFNRQGIPAVADEHFDPFTEALAHSVKINRQESLLPEEIPTLSIIIPTRDRHDLLKACISSLQETLKYPDQTEIIVIDNDSTEADTLEYLKELQSFGAARVIPFKGEFNWSAQNNLAVEQSTSDMLLFLNNDTLAMEDGWDEHVRAQLLRPEIGILGARLLFEDSTIQQAGVVFYSPAGGRIEGLSSPIAEGVYLERTKLEHATGAVIGAFMAMRREVFEVVGGFNKLDLAVTYNDYDMCFKVRDKNLLCLYSPRITFTHIGWETRGDEDLKVTEKSARAKKEYDWMMKVWKHLEPIDPYYPPAFARTGKPFTQLDSLYRLSINED